jgi:hypothetical protein
MEEHAEQQREVILIEKPRLAIVSSFCAYVEVIAVSSYRDYSQEAVRSTYVPLGI